MRTYELCFVADPRLSDEEVVALTDDYKQLLTSKGVEITKEESWGRRKLAYPIKKLTEGKYVLLYFSSPGGAQGLADVERRLLQNDKVLRFLTVRTDEDLKRAARVVPRRNPSPETEVGDRGDRGDRDDRGDRGDRGDREDRGGRGGRGDRGGYAG